MRWAKGPMWRRKNREDEGPWAGQDRGAQVRRLPWDTAGLRASVVLRALLVSRPAPGSLQIQAPEQRALQAGQPAEAGGWGRTQSPPANSWPESLLSLLSRQRRSRCGAFSPVLGLLALCCSVSGGL